MKAEVKDWKAKLHWFVGRVVTLWTEVIEVD
jgi:hypothetical protein